MFKKATEDARNNSIFLTLHLIMQGLIFAAYLLEVVKGSRTFSYFGILALIIIATVVAEIAVYKKDEETKLLRWVGCIGFEFMYAYVLLTAANPLIFVYAMLAMVMTVIYSDLKFLRLFNVLVIILNVVSVIKGALDGFGEQELPMDEIQVLSIIVISIFLHCISKGLLINSQEKIADIAAQEEEQKKTTGIIMETVDHMDASINEILSSVDVLSRSTQETKSAMEEVSNGANDTAASVQDEIQMTSDIQRSVDEVKSVSDIIDNNMKSAIDEIEGGRQDIRLLLEKVEASKSAGNKVVGELEELEKHTDQMHDITSLIDSVAKQTTLLALNASIEAARAGEAGKGFAVVADEITKLADQTSEATGDITALIDDLSGKLEEVVSSIQSLMRSNEEQNACANNAAESFGRIADSTKTAGEEAVILEDVVEKLREANSAIVDSISSVSAVSQEVSAHATDTLENTIQNEGIVEKVQELIHELGEDAKNLEAAKG